MSVTIATLTSTGELLRVEIRRPDVDAELLPGLARRSCRDRLVRFEVAGGEMVQAVGEAGVLAQAEQNGRAVPQDQVKIDNHSVRRHAAPRRLQGLGRNDITATPAFLGTSIAPGEVFPLFAFNGIRNRLAEGAKLHGSVSLPRMGSARSRV